MFPRDVRTHERTGTHTLNLTSMHRALASARHAWRIVTGIPWYSVGGGGEGLGGIVFILVSDGFV